MEELDTGCGPILMQLQGGDKGSAALPHPQGHQGLHSGTSTSCKAVKKSIGAFSVAAIPTLFDAERQIRCATE